MLRDVLCRLGLRLRDRFSRPLRIEPSPVTGPEMEREIVDVRRRMRLDEIVRGEKRSDGTLASAGDKVVRVKRMNVMSSFIDPSVERREIGRAARTDRSWSRLVR